MNNEDHFCPICRHLLGSCGTPKVEKCWNCDKKFTITEVPNKAVVEEFFDRIEIRRRGS